jgi:uncharacterized SAM-binding protein YcdF (DUF218 family)
MRMMLSMLFVAVFSPVGLALALLVCGFVFTFAWRKTRLAAAFNAVAFALLLAFSLPPAAHSLLRGLEGRYGPRREYGQASALVLLGGFTKGRVPPRLYAETNFDANRAFGAMRVWRQGVAPKMVLTGGLLEWTTNESVSEAASMFELLREHFGVDSAGVIFEEMSKNTKENAQYTREALTAAGLGLDIILVTSAYHMPRAAAVFEKAGFTVTPAPVGYLADSMLSHKPSAWLPSVRALFESSIALREYTGMAVYKIAGWI